MKVTEPLLVADCVGRAFGARRVLTSASLRATPGEVCALLGRNGTGKSTLLRIASGLTRPDSGIVRYDGVSRMPARLPQLAAEGLFHLPDHDLLSAAFTVRQQLGFLRTRFNGVDPSEAAHRTGVSQLLDRRPHQLSGGELRRAELAAVLVRRPRCLLADEPYRGIPPKDAEVLTDVLRELTRGGCAIVVTGHEVPTLLALADRVTWCTSGTAYELGAPAAARSHHAFAREFLGG